MWKCVFEKTTGKGAGFNRPATDDEFIVELPAYTCGWFNAYPDRYLYADGQLSERPEWHTEVAAREAEEAAEIADLQARVAEIEVAQNDSAVHNYTPQQITNYITNQIDGASTVAQVKEVIKQLLIKMAVYILK